MKNCNSIPFIVQYSFSTQEKIIDRNLDIINNFTNEPSTLDKKQVHKLLAVHLLTYADLKHHIYQYKLVNPNFVCTQVQYSEKVALKQQLGHTAFEKFSQFFQNHLNKNSDVFPVFSVNIENEVSISDLPTYLRWVTEKRTLTTYLCIIDAYNQADGIVSFVQNILSLFVFYFEKQQLNKQFLKEIKLILMKDPLIRNQTQQKADLKNSLFYTVDLSNSSIWMNNNQVYNFSGPQLSIQPKKIDLKAFMDENTLAKEAVDLNIKLMKWRALPSLQLDKIQNFKCLLFGAGTLGCQLARNLIGWGIRNIDFIDYGKVSYSNPVRQSLYDFEDSTNGGKPKARAAAEKLKCIFPEIESTGYEMMIPMPGHFITTEYQLQEMQKNVDQLEQLVESHDAIFLLTDNRESRWLPTVLASKYNKACIVVGLGFDSYVIIRQGVSVFQFDANIHKERLGCYFCNDTVSPNNSMKDRTLDQQCTVTRPGLSFISSAFASELLISLIHHPLQHAAPGDDEVQNLEETVLGILPQYIRGSLYNFETKLYFARAFDQQINFYFVLFHSKQKPYVI